MLKRILLQKYQAGNRLSQTNHGHYYQKTDVSMNTDDDKPFYRFKFASTCLFSGCAIIFNNQIS